MLTDHFVIRRATAADAPALSTFGRRVFTATFEADNNPADLAAYLDGAYTVAHQQADIADPSIDTLLLEIDGTLAAFAQVRVSEVPAGVGASALELARFYVDHRWHGRGVAARLMTAVETAATARGTDALWLGVWERNLRAQAFYARQGFTVVGSHTFLLGSDPQRDLIMEKKGLGGGLGMHNDAGRSR
jgi:ribosomal protein S18 acetylase RimI-like enzyme